MKHLFKGQSITLDRRDKYHLIVISKEDNDLISKLIQEANEKKIPNNAATEADRILNEKYNIHLKNIIAVGSGILSHSAISRIIVPIGTYETRKIFPCYCGYETNPIIRRKMRTYPILHEDCDASFKCALERLNNPDYTILIKENGEEDKENSKTDS